MLDGKMSDFVLFPLFGFIKPRNFNFEGHLIFDKKHDDRFDYVLPNNV